MGDSSQGKEWDHFLSDETERVKLIEKGREVIASVSHSQAAQVTPIIRES